MSAIRLLLDEDVRPFLAELLRDRGFDVIDAVSSGLGEGTDPEILQAAVDDRRTLLTHNVRHFVELATEYASKGWEHCGIIVADQAPIGDLLARMLRLLARKQAEDLLNSVEWLHNYRS